MADTYNDHQPGRRPPARRPVLQVPLLGEPPSRSQSTSGSPRRRGCGSLSRWPAAPGGGGAPRPAVGRVGRVAQPVVGQVPHSSDRLEPLDDHFVAGVQPSVRAQGAVDLVHPALAAVPHVAVSSSPFLGLSPCLWTSPCRCPCPGPCSSLRSRPRTCTPSRRPAWGSRPTCRRAPSWAGRCGRDRRRVAGRVVGRVVGGVVGRVDVVLVLVGAVLVGRLVAAVFVGRLVAAVLVGRLAAAVAGLLIAVIGVIGRLVVALRVAGLLGDRAVLDPGRRGLAALRFRLALAALALFLALLLVLAVLAALPGAAVTRAAVARATVSAARGTAAAAGRTGVGGTGIGGTGIARLSGVVSAGRTGAAAGPAGGSPGAARRRARAAGG